MAKPKYITDEEIQTLTNAIYNDTLQTHYEDVEDSHTVDYTGLLGEVSKEGEEWFQLNKLDEAHYFVSTLGRIFNAHRVSFVKPFLYKEYPAMHIRGKRTNIIEFLDEQGVTVSYLELLKNYNKFNYKCIETFHTVQDRLVFHQ